MKEQYDPSIARIMPPRKVYESVCIRIEDLESIREIELAKRCERVQQMVSKTKNLPHSL